MGLADKPLDAIRQVGGQSQRNGDEELDAATAHTSRDSCPRKAPGMLLQKGIGLPQLAENRHADLPRPWFVHGQGKRDLVQILIYDVINKCQPSEHQIR